MAGRPSNEIVSVEVHGLEELERAWPDWERRSERGLQDATYLVARIVSQVTALRVPVLTGRFKGSLTIERGLVDGRPAARVTEGEGLEYGRWLELGKRKNGRAGRGGRYLLPTARREKRLLKKQLADTTQREINAYPWPK